MRIDRSSQFFQISNNLTFRKNSRKVACSRVHQLTTFPVACRYKKQLGATETLAETLRYHMSPQCLHYSSPPCHAVPRGNTFHFSGAFIFSRRSHGVRSALSVEKTKNSNHRRRRWREMLCLRPTLISYLPARLAELWEA